MSKHWFNSLVCTILFLIVAGPASAQRPEDFINDVADEFERRRAEFLEKYDADGDGKLSREERESGFRAEREEFTKRYDVDGDGKLSQEEQREAWGKERERMQQEAEERKRIKEFDKDGDGKLSPAEKAAMDAAKKKSDDEKRAKLAELIKKYDTDKDLKINAAELAAIAAQTEKLIEELKNIEMIATLSKELGDNKYDAIARSIQTYKGFRPGGPGSLGPMGGTTANPRRGLPEATPETKPEKPTTANPRRGQ